MLNFKSPTLWSDVGTVVLGVLAFATNHSLVAPDVAHAISPIVAPALTVAAGVVGLSGHFDIRAIPGQIAGWFKRPDTQAALADLVRSEVAKAVAAAQSEVNAAGPSISA